MTLETWNICAEIDGYIITFHGEIVARAKGFDEARAIYNNLRAHSAMALESLRHVLEGRVS